jgi:hypothetical protein
MAMQHAACASAKKKPGARGAEAAEPADEPSKSPKSPPYTARGPPAPRARPGLVHFLPSRLRARARASLFSSRLITGESLVPEPGCRRPSGPQRRPAFSFSHCTEPFLTKSHYQPAARSCLNYTQEEGRRGESRFGGEPAANRPTPPPWQVGSVWCGWVCG